MKGCNFCNKELVKKEKILENETCIFLSGEGYNHEGVLTGSGIIIPKKHKETPFDLSEKEVYDTMILLKKVKDYLDKKFNPDGYSIGWNIGEVSGQAVFHAHLHVMPRYNDELLAGKGIRHFLKQKENKRGNKK